MRWAPSNFCWVSTVLELSVMRIAQMHEVSNPSILHMCSLFQNDAYKMVAISNHHWVLACTYSIRSGLNLVLEFSRKCHSAPRHCVCNASRCFLQKATIIEHGGVHRIPSEGDLQPNRSQRHGAVAHGCDMDDTAALSPLHGKYLPAPYDLLANSL